MRFELVLLVALASPAAADEIADAKRRWAESPHGPLLERILPPTFEERQLPQPRSRGARLTLRYCVQCHNLPNPAMHHAQKWPGIVERMVVRMQENMQWMNRVVASRPVPSEPQLRVEEINAFLEKYARRP